MNAVLPLLSSRVGTFAGSVMLLHHVHGLIGGNRRDVRDSRSSRHWARLAPCPSASEPAAARVAGELPAPAFRTCAVTVIVEPQVVVGVETASVLPGKLRRLVRE